MPRNYKPQAGAKTYKKYNESVMRQALAELEFSSLQTVATKYNISKTVLFRHRTFNLKPQGGQPGLSNEVEDYIVENLNVCGEWGYPLDTTDLRHIIKMYLDTAGITHKRFKNNYPGSDYISGFLKRNKGKISSRICQNIKRSRAAISPDVIRDYFRELEKSLENVPLSNIVNYDETNLADDPGRKKVIIRRGCKYPERVVDHSKGSVSLMMAGSAEGEMLPPYVVYKATHLYDTWVKNGPEGGRYNRSASGWFDGDIFADWVESIAIPYFANKDGKKLLIGDNLASHLSLKVIKMCHERNISFVFLPANSTHLTQPLDVAFFRPFKIAWRQILDQWKKTDGKFVKSIPKGCFPRLLKILIEKVKANAEKNIRAGFRKTGIAPFDLNAVLSRLPTEKDSLESKESVDESFLKLLKEMRYGTMNITEPKRKKKIEVVAGKSVVHEEINEVMPNNMEHRQDEPSTSSTKPKPKKGKGIGKKSLKKEGLAIKTADLNKDMLCHNEKENKDMPAQAIYSPPLETLNYILANVDQPGSKENEENRCQLMEAGNISIDNIDVNTLDLEALPVVYSEHLDFGYQEEISVMTDCKEPNIGENRSKIKIISDIKLPLPCPSRKKRLYSQPVENITSNTIPVSKVRRNSCHTKNFYNNEQEILRILQD